MERLWKLLITSKWILYGSLLHLTGTQKALQNLADNGWSWCMCLPSVGIFEQASNQKSDYAKYFKSMNTGHPLHRATGLTFIRNEINLNASKLSTVFLILKVQLRFVTNT